MASLRLSTLALAIAAAFGLPAHAQSNEQLLKELNELRARITELESKANSPGPAKAASAEWGMTQEQVRELNRISVKTEALEDAQESLGLKMLKISGYIEPTFIANHRQHRAGFQFLNPVAQGGYGYDNGYFGVAGLDFQKEMDGGTRWRLTLMPNRGAGSIADSSSYSIVHEASFSVPLTDLQTRFIGGQIPDWSGYEYVEPTRTKLVTRSLWLDFAAPTYYTGAGLNVIRGKWDVKAMLANYNVTAHASGKRAPVIAYRADYAKGEFAGFGLAGVHGKAPNLRQDITAATLTDVVDASGNVIGSVPAAEVVGQPDSRLDLFEVDGYFIRGDVTLQGQVGLGRQKAAGITPAQDGALRSAQWWYLSALGAYKVTPRLELVARGDYIRNDKNGGGLLGWGADAFNGIGPNGNLGCGADPAANASECSTGANRWALSFGGNYLLTRNVLLKAEYRIDGATQPVFLDSESGTFHKLNHLLGGSVVVSF